MTRVGTGRAEAITDADIAVAADGLGCHPATLEAISKTESAGFGWFPNGQIKILPEPHKFHQYLPKGKRHKALKMGLSTTSYEATKSSGHYGRMKGARPRYELLQKWSDYDRDAAFMAISVGRYQIMGFNWKKCGFRSVHDMWHQFLDSEANQLRAFVNFLRKSNLVTALRDNDFELVEERYNGGGQGGAYARIMRKHYKKLIAGKWKGYKPGSMVAPDRPQKPVEPTKPVPPPTPSKKQKGGLWAMILAALGIGGGGAASATSPPEYVPLAIALGLLAVIAGLGIWIIGKRRARNA